MLLPSGLFFPEESKSRNVASVRRLRLPSSFVEPWRCQLSYKRNDAGTFPVTQWWDVLSHNRKVTGSLLTAAHLRQSNPHHCSVAERNVSLYLALIRNSSPTDAPPAPHTVSHTQSPLEYFLKQLSVSEFLRGSFLRSALRSAALEKRLFLKPELNDWPRIRINTCISDGQSPSSSSTSPPSTPPPTLCSSEVWTVSCCVQRSLSEPRTRMWSTRSSIRHGSASVACFSSCPRCYLTPPLPRLPQEKKVYLLQFNVVEKELLIYYISKAPRLTPNIRLFMWNDYSLWSEEIITNNNSEWATAPPGFTLHLQYCVCVCVLSDLFNILFVLCDYSMTTVQRGAASPPVSVEKSFFSFFFFH